MSQTRINRISRNRIGQTSGMSLLEVMIAVLVFSVGLIGVAALMLTSMRNNDATLSRTQSTMLANEMYEKMLANLRGVADDDYSITMAATLPTTASPECDIAVCDTVQLADWDLWQWSDRLTNVLVGADASITVVDATVDPVIIEIRIILDPLMETAGAADLIDETFTFRARL